MDRDHNELAAKLEFVHDLSISIVVLARSRSSPLAESIFVDDVNNVVATPMTSSLAGSAVFVSERQRSVEQLMLYMRALELLASALHLARNALTSGRLHATTHTRQMLKEMNSNYQQCLAACKELNKSGALLELSSQASLSAASMTTDRLLYCCAIEMCQAAVVDELLGDLQECYQQYHGAYLLLHSLLQQADDADDRKLLNKYKDGVVKRLMNLHSQGYISAKYFS
jgi:serine/threonine-protein kinase ULK/ATG1